MAIQLAAAALFAALSFPGLAGAETKLTILHLNDLYNIDAAGGRGGAAEVKTVIDRERAKAENSILTFGGDLISPSLLSGFDKGAHMIDILNALGVDYAALGNHEFDFGLDTLSERIKESNFPWFTTNIAMPDGSRVPGTVYTQIREVDGFKLGFLGLTTTDTPSISSSGDLQFKDSVAAAAAAAEELKAAGADLVIAITHLELSKDLSLLREVAPIDIVLGGHDHDVVSFYNGTDAILKAGTEANFVGVLDLTIDRVTSRGREKVVWSPEFRQIAVTGVERDPAVGAIVDTLNASLDKELNVDIGTTDTELDSRRASVRGRETVFGDLIADAMRASVGADIGLTNGGGIRGDRVYNAGTMLTRRDILTELPFGNVTVKLAMSGADVRAALENGVSRVEDVSGRFPQVSGLTFTYDLSLPPGERVTSVMVGGEPLDPARTYTVATNDFLARGGDGYDVFRTADVLINASAGTLMATTVIDFIQAAGEIAPTVEGRIVSE